MLFFGIRIIFWVADNLPLLHRYLFRFELSLWRFKKCWDIGSHIYTIRFSIHLCIDRSFFFNINNYNNFCVYWIWYLILKQKLLVRKKSRLLSWFLWQLFDLKFFLYIINLNRTFNQSNLMLEEMQSS